MQKSYDLLSGAILCARVSYASFPGCKHSEYEVLYDRVTVRANAKTQTDKKP